VLILYLEEADCRGVPHVVASVADLVVSRARAAATPLDFALTSRAGGAQLLVSSLAFMASERVSRSGSSPAFGRVYGSLAALRSLTVTTRSDRY
jgi:hypothetical protein